jgi:hypothetical protein
MAASPQYLGEKQHVKVERKEPGGGNIVNHASRLHPDGSVPVYLPPQQARMPPIFEIIMAELMTDI